MMKPNTKAKKQPRTVNVPAVRVSGAVAADHRPVYEALTGRQKIEVFGEENILARMQCGISQAEIAKEIGVQPSVLCEWLDCDNERSARARQARLRSAESWMDRGLTALCQIPDDGSQAQIARAREIAQHCRKMAAIRNPATHGDKLSLAGDPNNPIQTINRIEIQVVK